MHTEQNIGDQVDLTKETHRPKERRLAAGADQTQVTPINILKGNRQRQEV